MALPTRNNRLFLFSGLGLLFVAIVLRELGLSPIYWASTFSIAILLKSLFVFQTLRARNFALSWGVKLILIGVVTILISLIFRYLLPIEWLRAILFYSALGLKLSGVLLIAFEKIRASSSRP